MDWTIDENVPWLSLSDTAGGIVDTVVMFPLTDGMTLGQYTDSFYIESPGAENNPKKVKVIFKVWKYHGDCNWDGKVNLLDLVYMVDYIFRSPSPAPIPVMLTATTSSISLT